MLTLVSISCLWSNVLALLLFLLFIFTVLNVYNVQVFNFAMPLLIFFLFCIPDRHMTMDTVESPRRLFSPIVFEMHITNIFVSPMQH